ncbi:MAG: NAD-dependent epimerase/dehydratase family protein [Prochloraceae cyanobacterium]|nr:NAD-dependent epimerase/dehydratase family protein [Prochloraceae cyanobacterium]
MKTVLITGATGFIGTHLVPALHQQGWQITAAVRNNYSRLPSTPIKTVQVGEIDGKTNWTEALAGGVEKVIHLAARAHIIEDNAPSPEAEFLRVNTEGTANLVKQSIKAGVKHFVFVSSIGAMATSSDRILNEKSPCQPDTPYGWSKLKAELELTNLARDSNMTWTIIRPTLVYGPGNPGNMERLVKLVKSGLPLPFGNTNNRRSLVFVGNLVDAIAICLIHPQARKQIFLVSDGQDISTPNLVRQIARQMHRPCRLLPVSPSLLKFLGKLGDAVQEITHKKIPLNTPTVNRLLGSLFVESSYIQTTLNWHPPFTIDRGLQETIGSQTS